MRFSLLALFLVLLYAASAQTQVTISGTISEAESGETLIGATVRALESGEGALTNTYGFYSLTLPAGSGVPLEFSYVGFQPVQITLNLKNDTVIDIELASGLDLQEVVVQANSFREQLSDPQMSVESLSPRQAKLLPALLGEVDIIKTLQLKPGISSGSEGSSGLFVRGGGPDQNLILLDEAIVYNANHLFGFFSTFNSDAIKDVKVYKGGFPAQYGGRLSSVIDVKLREGNRKDFSGSGGIGLISSRLTLEGPLKKDKSSFMVSGRRTYVDLITSGINRANADNPDFDPIPDYYFYDLNAKVNVDLGENDRIFLSGYFGRDVFAFDNETFNFNFDWGNATGTARWNHTFNSKLFSNTTLTLSDYQYNISNQLTGFSFNLGSSITDASLKTDFYYAADNTHTLRFGISSIYHSFEVGRLKAGSTDGQVQFSAGQDFDGTELGIYFSDDIDFSDRFRVQTGFRLSGFTNDGDVSFGLEPRLAGRYTMNQRISLKASYARMFQYIHLVSNSNIALPTDIWYPSTANVKPQRSDQVAAGWAWQINPNLLFTNEFYYKWLENQIDFKDFAELFANDNLEEEFAFGNGNAYGMEVGLEKPEGRLTGWLGYTLAFIRRGNFRSLDGTLIDNGAFFPPRYDRRHDLSVVGIYQMTKRISASAAFVFGSGDISWLPTGRFFVQDSPGRFPFPAVPDYPSRNNFRLPPYHRLDLSIVFRFDPSWGESDLTVSIYNIYNRRNPYFVYLEPTVEEVQPLTGEGPSFEVLTGISPKQVSLFPAIPSLTYNFKF